MGLLSSLLPAQWWWGVLASEVLCFVFAVCYWGHLQSHPSVIDKPYNHFFSDILSKGKTQNPTVWWKINFFYFVFSSFFPPLFCCVYGLCVCSPHMWWASSPFVLLTTRIEIQVYARLSPIRTWKIMKSRMGYLQQPESKGYGWIFLRWMENAVVCCSHQSASEL